MINLNVIRKKIPISNISIMLIIFIFFFISSCSLIADMLTDCIDADNPEFSPKTIEQVTSGVYFKTVIKAFIDNEPYDNDYRYTLTINGKMPQGVSTKADNRNRSFIIEGTPAIKGAFDFTLTVEVEDPSADDEDYNEDEEENYDDGDDLCSSSASQDYTLVVN